MAVVSPSIGKRSCSIRWMSSQLCPTTISRICDTVVRPPLSTTKSTIALAHTASAEQLQLASLLHNSVTQNRRRLHLPQHFLYFLPLPHGQGSLRPIFGSSRVVGFSPTSSPSSNFQPSASFTKVETSWWLQNSPFAV